MGKNNEGQNGTDDLESLITSELVSNYIQNKITKIHLGKQLAKNVNLAICSEYCSQNFPSQ